MGYPKTKCSHLALRNHHFNSGNDALTKLLGNNDIVNLTKLCSLNGRGNLFLVLCNESGAVCTCAQLVCVKELNCRLGSHSADRCVIGSVYYVCADALGTEYGSCNTVSLTNDNGDKSGGSLSIGVCKRSERGRVTCVLVLSGSLDTNGVNQSYNGNTVGTAEVNEAGSLVCRIGGDSAVLYLAVVSNDTAGNAADECKPRRTCRNQQRKRWLLWYRYQEHRQARR